MKRKIRQAVLCIMDIVMFVLLILMILYNKEEVLSVLGGIARTQTTAGSGNETKKIALTFDDGPSVTYTEKLLDGLKERNVRVSFFVMGSKAEENPDLIKRMQADGHLIGNHTYSHMQLQKGCEEQFIRELQKTSEIIEDITGEGTEYVRPPFGTWEKKFEKKLNMFPVMWTIDPLDWNSKDAAAVTKRVVDKAKENAIILMHDQYKSSVTAAFNIIDILQSKGYEFVTVDELMFD